MYYRLVLAKLLRWQVMYDPVATTRPTRCRAGTRFRSSSVTLAHKLSNLTQHQVTAQGLTLLFARPRMRHHRPGEALSNQAVINREILELMLPRTQRQKEILDYITRFLERHGYEPSYAQVARHFGVKSRATIAKHVAALERRGLLTRKGEDGSFALTVKVDDSDSLCEVKLLGGCCGCATRSVDEETFPCRDFCSAGCVPREFCFAGKETR